MTFWRTGAPGYAPVQLGGCGKTSQTERHGWWVLLPCRGGGALFNLQECKNSLATTSGGILWNTQDALGGSCPTGASLPAAAALVWGSVTRPARGRGWLGSKKLFDMTVKIAGLLIA